jgi:putative addiction module killer protein
MPSARSTDDFERWLGRLRDQRGRALILGRLDRLREGHAGDVRPVGGKVIEMRIDFGPGYRIYFTRFRGSIMLLLGGDKGSQQRDIAKAQRLASELK